ncbi:kinase [Lithospermum erythrorhizon]|uniref:Kinase n=1 Tax=Lithospermum erythrorhizon TaxID=34254 RepID=A0AAV3PSC5_LITER
MAKICLEAESTIDYPDVFKRIMNNAPVPMSPLESLASSAVRTANSARAALILVLTRGGSTAKLVAKYRPRDANSTPTCLWTITCNRLLINRLS